MPARWLLLSREKIVKEKAKEYKKCTVQHGDEKREVLLPEEIAHVGEKIVIKEPDNSGLWEVVDLVKIAGNNVAGNNPSGSPQD